jgi:hypothetical protein
MENYTPNSHKFKEEQKENIEKKKVEKIVSGKVATKKKSGILKIAEIFVPEDVTNVKEYVITDIIVPAVKAAISDIVNIYLYGEPRQARRSTSTNSRVSYGRYYEKQDKPSYRSEKPVRSGYDYDDIILDNRGDAEGVLVALDDIIAEYGVTSVADLYELVGIDENYTDHKYGWTNLSTAKVVRAGDGYLLKLPKALPIN